MDLQRFYCEAKDAYLLTIDLQEKLVPAMYKGAACVERCLRMLQAAAILQIPGCATEQYPRGLGATLPELQAALSACEHPVYDKVQFNALIEPVENHLKETGKKTVVVIGIEAHVCVYQTVRALLERGYRVFIPEDAVRSRAKSNLKNALRQFEQMGACVTNTETILFDWMKGSDQPAFKPLSALVK